jgi:tryptophan 7-halogenase
VKNIVIVGGGTAGWLTALYTQKMLPQDNIVLVESSDIGILGAGEGSVPIFTAFLESLDIKVEDLIQKTKSTIKTSIKFTNWSNNSDYYYHDFSYPNTLFFDSFINIQNSFYNLPCLRYERFYNIVKNNKNYSENDFLHNNNLVPFSFKDDVAHKTNSMDDFSNYLNYAFHFDARLLANFLSEIAISRGIKVIDGKIIEIKNNEKNKISELILENGQSVLTDFVFDCSGFSRLLIGKHYKSKWKSFSEYLPMKKALPFFIDINPDNIPPYTESIAMKYGWIWKIPLQHRYGCGYVFDSDYVDEEEIKKEIEEYLGYKPVYPRENKGAFSFNAGVFESVWIENCLSVGLSSGFLEPLEATSIVQLVSLLQNFFFQKHAIFSDNKEIRKILNEQYVKETTMIADFLSLHYTTNKTDSIFWIDFKKKNKTSQYLLDRLSLLQNSVMTYKYDDQWFLEFNYYAVALGNEIIDIENLKNIYYANNIDKMEKEMLDFSKTKRNFISNFISHSHFLKYLGGLNDEKNN